MHKNEYINDKALKVVLQISETSANVSTALTIYYKVIEENLKAKKYLNALSRLDEVINKLEEVDNPEIIASKFIELLDKFLLVCHNFLISSFGRLMIIDLLMQFSPGYQI